MQKFHFFATGEEIKKCFLELEKERPLKYVIMKDYVTPNVDIYNSITDIPHIGISIGGDFNDELYTVLDKDADIPMIPYLTPENKTEYAAEGNPNGVYFFLNGMYEDKYLIWNHICTIENCNERGLSLYKEITERLKKISKKVSHEAYVTKGVYDLYDQRNGKIRLITWWLNEDIKDDVLLRYL